MNRLMKSVKKGLHGGWEIESKWRGGRWRNRSDYQDTGTLVYAT